jgi:hypothetical protein
MDPLAGALKPAGPSKGVTDTRPEGGAGQPAWYENNVVRRAHSESNR